MTAKRFLLSVAAAGGAFTFCRWLTANQARILAYHGVDDRDEPLLNFDGFHVHPEIFERHLRTLKGHYKVVPLRELAEIFQRGEAPPPRAVAITFDDGYLNNLTHAAPLLNKYGLPATFFVTTGFMDGTHQPWWFRLRSQIAASAKSSGEMKREIIATETELKRMNATSRDEALATRGVPAAAPYPMLDWSGVKMLMEQGHEIGAHTVSHISMGHETPKTVAREIRESIARISKMTGVSPTVYSYPYGEGDHQNETIARLVREAGCRGGVTSIEGLNPRGSDPFRLKRLNITGHHDRNAFRALVSGFTGAVRK